MIKVIATNEFAAWYRDLSDPDADAVTRTINLLEASGVSLGFPYSSAIQGTRYPIRELRTQSQGRPLPVFYAFDPERQAVLLIGGDKTGDHRFYETFIPIAEKLWVEHLAELGR